MYIQILSKELQEKAKKELNEEPSQIEEHINYIREWLVKQPHLNARTDDLWLLNFLRGSKFSLQRAKEKLDMLYTIRSLTPEYFANRDPFLPEMQDLMKRGVILPLEAPNMSIVLIRWKNTNPKEVPFQNIMKLALMYLDIFLYEDNVCMIAGQHIINDYEGFCLSYLQQTTPTIIQEIFSILLKAYPMRPKGFHCINAPSYMDFILDIGKPFMSRKFRDRIHIYSKNETKDIFKHIPISAIPKEYGGEGCTVKEIRDKWKRKVESYRDWFLEDALYRSDESKRLGKSKTSADVYGVEGSFRKLQVD